jgi:CheY-like chemotaxis protein
VGFQDTKRIVVVDDTESVAFVIKSFLEDEGFRVSAHEDPHDALIDIGSNGADLVITDYTMPGMNGIELVERIKKYNPRTDAIIITADPLRISEYEGRFEVIEKTQGFIKKIIAAVYNIFKMPP